MTTEQQETSVVSQAGQQVQEKAGALKSQAADSLREQVDQRSSQAGDQVSAVSQALRSSGEQLRSEGHETPAKLIDGAAQRVDSVGSYLRDANSDRILSDAERWARSRPWLAAAAGALVGFAASRFLKASSSRRYEQLSTSNGSSFDGSRTYSTRERLGRHVLRGDVMATQEQQSSETQEELRDQSTGDLVKQLSAQVSTLVRQEVELAKVEMADKGKKAGVGLGMFGGAGVAALLALGALTAFLVLVLHQAIPAWAAALVVTVIWGAVAGVLALQGRRIQGSRSTHSRANRGERQGGRRMAERQQEMSRTSSRRGRRWVRPSTPSATRPTSPDA